MAAWQLELSRVLKIQNKSFEYHLPTKKLVEKIESFATVVNRASWSQATTLFHISTSDVVFEWGFTLWQQKAARKSSRGTFEWYQDACKTPNSRGIHTHLRGTCRSSRVHARWTNGLEIMWKVYLGDIKAKNIQRFWVSFWSTRPKKAPKISFPWLFFGPLQIQLHKWNSLSLRSSYLYFCETFI